MPQTIADIKAGLAQASTFTEIIKDLIKANDGKATKRKNLYERYAGEKAQITYDESADPIDYDGIPIYNRPARSRLKINHRLHAPFIGKIVLNMVGFIGTVDIGVDQKKFAAPKTAASEQPSADEKPDVVTKSPEQELIDKLINDFTRINSMNKTHSTLVEDADCTGCAYGMAFQDGDGNVYFKRLKPWETIVVRNAQTDFPELGVRYWKIEISRGVWRWYVEIYDDTNVYYFLENNTGGFEVNKTQAPEVKEKLLAAGQRPHLMGKMPIIEFPKNEQRIGDPERTLSLQDSYNVSISDFSSELAQLRMAYLARKNATGGAIDEKFLQALEKTGILLGEWDFVTKTLDPNAVKHHQQTIRQLIFDLSNSVDFSADDFNAAMPIIAFKLKCKGLDDSATQIINQFTESYYYLFEILVGFWKEFRGAPAALEPTDMTVTINKNLPVNIKEVLDNFVNAGGKLSNKTLLEITLPQLNVQHSVEEEEARIEKEGNSEISQPEDFMSDTTTTGQPGDDAAGADGGFPPDVTANGNPPAMTGRRTSNA